MIGLADGIGGLAVVVAVVIVLCMRSRRIARGELVIDLGAARHGHGVWSTCSSRRVA